MNITLNNLHWIHYIESLRKGDKKQSSYLSKWRILSRFEMLENGTEHFKFAGGEEPNKLLFELNLMSANRNLDEIKNHKLENSAGALTCLGNKYSNDFIISGIIVLNDGAYDEAISSARLSTFTFSQFILSLEGLEPPKSNNAIPIWNNVNNKNLKISHVQTNFHYGHTHLTEFYTKNQPATLVRSL
ncbi:hypothetical protein [Nitrosomonas supralitoralis]|uniref:Uncharacterized protein n=1 Tax=Nitrosomonas supralitoralis TaxID=2116706 RepID=A0A2P7NRA1_9PROT|nr:hypothetical protein [Nitrosomonas supralitoralis]PSJ16011.1 hypothetical protein C7H79_15875 [Nitrosomonas supralitoralis]